MILLTGASGTVGRALLPLLLEAGQDVRALVRDPRGLGRHRVDVQIALGDLAHLGDRHLQRQALRGVDTVIHLAAAIRDEPHARVEELNGLATVRLLRAAERAGIERFVFFSALGASDFQRTRFFRAKALAEQAVDASPLDDHGLRAVHRLRPGRPLGAAHEAAGAPARYSQSRDRGAVAISRSGRPTWPDASWQPWSAVTRARYELAGPEILTYDQIARTVAREAGRERPLAHVPLSLVHLTLVALRRVFGEAVFATWEEAELMEVPMTTPRGTGDAESLGVTPLAVREVLRAA